MTRPVADVYDAMGAMPEMKTDAVRERFEAWLAEEIAHNGGIQFGADYRHWAFKGYQAAIRSPAVAGLAADARRYAFLRDDPPVELAVRRREDSKRDGLSYLYIDGPQLDNEIDAALAQYATLAGGKV